VNGYSRLASILSQAQLEAVSKPHHNSKS